MIRRLTPVLAALALVATGALPAGAQAQGDNTAIAINTKDGTAVFRLAFAIRRVAGDTVDSTNAAVAFSSCTDCQATAIAIEIVLITGDSSVVTPTNLALAFNLECNACISVADAYQFVFSTGGQVHFTAEGNRILAEIRRELEALRHENLTIAELQARLQAIVARLKYVLSTQLVPAGNSGSAATTSAAPTATTPAQPPTTEPTPTTTETTTSTASTTTAAETTTAETTTTP